MKRAFLVATIAFLAGVGISAFSYKAEKKGLTTYNVVTDFSKVEWVGAKKSGYHSGVFKVKSGDVKFDGNKLAGGKFVIDMNSLALIGEDAPKFVEHLKSNDFFGTATFSEATFEIAGVEYVSDADVNIRGSLNLKGVSVPLSFPAVIRNADDKRLFAQAFFSLDRTLWGINYGAGNIAKDVQVSVYLFANK